jgi:multicomponent Na+:H+ antiporter subunit G
MIDALVILLAAIGGCFSLLGAVGLARMPDFLTRMQAATKAGTLGVGMIALAVAVQVGDVSGAVRALLIVGFLFLTAPVAAHMISRAAYRRRTPVWERTVVDDLRSALADEGDDRQGPSS